MIKNHESVSIEMERALMKLLYQEKFAQLQLTYHPHLDHYFSSHEKEHFIDVADRYNWQVDIYD